MTGLYIVLGIILLIFLLLSLPILIFASYNQDGPLIKISWFFIPLYNSSKPKKPKKKKKKGKKPVNNHTDDVKKGLFASLKQKGVEDTADFLQNLFREIFTLLGHSEKSIKIKRFSVDISVSSQDAAQTALLYGGLCAGIYPVCSFILKKIKHNNKNITISVRPDFDKTVCEYDVKILLAMDPRRLIAVGAGMAKRLIMRSVKARLKNNEPAKPENKE